MYWLVYTSVVLFCHGGVVPKEQGIVNSCLRNLHSNRCILSFWAPTMACLPANNHKLKRTFEGLLQRCEETKIQSVFLKKCKEKKVIPKGLQLSFNITGVPSQTYFQNVQATLNKAASRLLDELIEEKQKAKDKSETEIYNMWTKLQEILGNREADRLADKAKQSLKRTLSRKKSQLERKLEKLLSMPRNDITFQGSTKMRGTQYDPHNRSDPFPKTNRPHRQRRHRKPGRKPVTKNTHVPSDASKITSTSPTSHPFDPIVIPDIELTQDQISICRLPDCFAPTPREPINVCDQLLGTHDWAERLRWHSLHEKQKMDQEDDSQDDDEAAFIKMPWYKRTSKSAPKTNPALETFIKACKSEFMDPNKRRRIRDNLTHGQRIALRELKSLPMTKGIACRFADKSGNTVITALEDDDKTIFQALEDQDYYDTLTGDPTPTTTKKIKSWAEKWLNKGAIDKNMADYVTNISDTKPGKCKPLVKTHKPEPYPTRLLISGCGTPVQPISKLVQLCINHLTQYLPYQILDTKEFLQKIEEINSSLTPLPDTACFATCDVISLYPNVNNNTGIPATRKLLAKYPSPQKIPTACILEALTISLENNAAKYTDEDRTVYAKPNRGIAMGPSHACDFVDIFMGELDTKLVETCPIPLLSDTCSTTDQEKNQRLDWSRFRDDGIAILPNKADAARFEGHLQKLHPPSIKWTVTTGTQAEYLDVKLKIESGKITTDVHSKHCHSYLPPNSCHAPSVYKGLITSVGTRLRILCSNDQSLQERISEYAGYFEMSGWKRDTAERELKKGANTDRHKALFKPRRKPSKKHAWVTTFDPRFPSKTEIIKRNLHLLYSDPENKKIFPPKSIISADRRRKNIGEIYKPTVPQRLVEHGPKTNPGFWRCTAKRCDTCAHSLDIQQFTSPWDGRTWKIRKTLTCTTKCVIYVIRCTIHRDAWYVGSSTNLKFRWAGHKSDVKLGKTQKCQVAQHMNSAKHPQTSDLHQFLEVFAVDTVKDEKQLGARETWWIANIGTIFRGLNVRMDLPTTQKSRIQF